MKTFVRSCLVDDHMAISTLKLYFFNTHNTTKSQNCHYKIFIDSRDILSPKVNAHVVIPMPILAMLI